MTRILIAGSGVAAVETALALRALDDERLQIDLLRQPPSSTIGPGPS